MEREWEEGMLREGRKEEREILVREKEVEAGTEGHKKEMRRTQKGTYRNIQRLRKQSKNRENLTVAKSQSGINMKEKSIRRL